MKWLQIPLGPLETNCYILYNREKQCIIFDPGDEGERLLDYLSEQTLTPIAIVLTHAHFDHIGAIDYIRRNWDIPLYIHDLEKEWLANPLLNGSSHFAGEIMVNPAEEIIHSETNLKVGPFTLRVMHTPGHSPGSLSYYVKEANAVFAGDTLFRGSIGRTDLPGGSHSILLASIKNKLFTLPEDTTVLPGHGPETTVRLEKETNPFLT